jgi:hypothetical protein
MAAIIMKAVVPDAWEDDWESSVDSFVNSLKPPSPPSPQVRKEEVVPQAPAIQSTKITTFGKDYYEKYPYFKAGLHGTLLRQLYPDATKPLGELKRDLASGKITLSDIVMAVRNDYIMPLYNVAKSTKYFNPVARKFVPQDDKRERVDPKLRTHVSLDDQLRFYRLFGFQGHQERKLKGDEDAIRTELLGHLRDILYKPEYLEALIRILLCGRMYIEVDSEALKKACVDIQLHESFDKKSYTLPTKWFHDPTWKKLRYVYGKGIFANLGCGTESQFSSELMEMAKRENSYKK